MRKLPSQQGKFGHDRGQICKAIYGSAGLLLCHDTQGPQSCPVTGLVDCTTTMAVAYELPAFSKEAVANTASLLRVVILVFISGAAIASRLFAVINFESIIHEL